MGGTLAVSNGGTGTINFAPYAPVIGGVTTQGALQSASTGQLIAGSVFTSNGSGLAPTWEPVSAITSVLAGNNISITGSSATSPIVNVAGTTDNALQIGSPNGALHSLSFGTTGQILTSNGAGSSPSWQAVPSSSITITGDTGGALTGDSFTFTGGTTGLKFNGAGTTETLSGTLAIANGGTGATSLAANGIIISNAGARPLLRNN